MDKKYLFTSNSAYSSVLNLKLSLARGVDPQEMAISILNLIDRINKEYPDFCEWKVVVANSSEWLPISRFGITTLNNDFFEFAYLSFQPMIGFITVDVKPLTEDLIYNRHCSHNESLPPVDLNKHSEKHWNAPINSYLLHDTLRRFANFLYLRFSSKIINFSISDYNKLDRVKPSPF